MSGWALACLLKAGSGRYRRSSTWRVSMACPLELESLMAPVCRARVSGVNPAPEGLTCLPGEGPTGGNSGLSLRSGMQPGAVALRGALLRAWEGDLRAVRQDSFDAGRGREALLFIQRFYGLISELRQPIQQAWAPGGHVHVVDSPDLGGPGPRVSQSRIRLRNHGELVAVELFTYTEGDSRANHAAGLDREIRVADADPLFLVNELYRTAVDFRQVALNLDLALAGTAWLFEHAAAQHFVENARWPSVAEVYRRATREFAVSDSFESVSIGVSPPSEGLANANGHSTNGDGAEMALSIDQLQRYEEPQGDLEAFVQLVRVAVAADQEDARATSP